MNEAIPKKIILREINAMWEDAKLKGSDREISHSLSARVVLRELKNRLQLEETND